MDGKESLEERRGELFTRGEPPHGDSRAAIRVLSSLAVRSRLATTYYMIRLGSLATAVLQETLRLMSLLGMVLQSQ